jgi:hypothetical protein
MNAAELRGQNVQIVVKARPRNQALDPTKEKVDEFHFRAFLKRS